MGDGKMTTEAAREYMSVTEMAERLGMSRSNLYTLIERGILLPPIYLTSNRQPIYSRSVAERNILVKNTGIAINGQPTKFYRRRGVQSSSQSRRVSHRSIGQRRTRTSPGSILPSLVADLKSLGLNTVTEDAVTAALAELFPSGTAGVAEGDVIRSIYRRLRR